MSGYCTRIPGCALRKNKAVSAPGTMLPGLKAICSDSLWKLLTGVSSTSLPIFFQGNSSSGQFCKVTSTKGHLRLKLCSKGLKHDASSMECMCVALPQ